MSLNGSSRKSPMTENLNCDQRMQFHIALKMESSELCKESQISMKIALYISSLNSLHREKVNWITGGYY